MKIVIFETQDVFREGLAAILKQLFITNNCFFSNNHQQTLIQVSTHKPELILYGFEAISEKINLKLIQQLQQCSGKSRIIAVLRNNNDTLIEEIKNIGIKNIIFRNTSCMKISEIINSQIQEISNLETLNKSIIPEHDLYSEASSIKKTTSFTKREMEIIALICQEYSNKEIAANLCLSCRTVEGYRIRIIEKMGVKSAAGVVRFAVENKLIY